jgi:hypothetical protein
MPRSSSVRQLFKPVLFGALTACAPLFAYDLPVAVMVDGAWLICLYITAISFSVAVVIILAASVLVGLPVTALLQQRHLESGRTYLGLGASIGATIALALVPIWLGIKEIGGAYAIVVPLSAASGAVTAWTWWRGRSVSAPLQPQF